MGASGSLAEGTPQRGVQEAEAARLEWRHCSVTWGKDCKARKMMTLTVNAILFWLGDKFFLSHLKRPSVFEVSNFSVSSQYLVCGRESQIPKLRERTWSQVPAKREFSILWADWLWLMSCLQVEKERGWQAKWPGWPGSPELRSQRFF